MTVGDDEELFNAAMNETPEAPASGTDQPPAAADAPPAVDEGPARDPVTGQFAKKQTAETPPVEAQPATESPAQEPATPEPKREDHRIPLAEPSSVRERAQRAEQERDQERQSRADLERRFQMLERQMVQARQPPKETPDVWSDPEGFVRAQLEPVRSGQEAVLERISRAMAVDKFGQEAVNTAMSELERQMMTNPNARFEHQRIMASDHPYGELVAWHKRQNALKEIGEDPSAYKARILEDAKKDPAFIAAVIEAARTQAQQPAANGARPQTAVNLPPSLNRTTGSGGQATMAAPKNDGEIFQELFPQ